jgi:5-methylthioadenosine/S-adenosylhomocysteine deaminase
MDASLGDFANADVLIDEGKIVAVGPRLSAEGAEVVDASGKIVMPGFVDTHRHLWQGLIRNSGSNDILGDYLANVLFGVAPVITPDEVYVGDLVSALSALNSGITTILDWSHIATTVEHTDAAIAALRDSGIPTIQRLAGRYSVLPAHVLFGRPLSVAAVTCRPRGPDGSGGGSRAAACARPSRC